jgi:MFS family permease
VIAHTLVPTLGMLAVLTLSSMSMFTVTVLAPEAAPAMGVDPSLIGVFLAVAYSVAMVAGTATGTLIDRFGPIAVCQATLVCAAAGLALASLATPAALLPSALALGLAYGPFNPASAHVLSGLASPRWQPMVFSVKQTGVPLGGVLAGALVPGAALAIGWEAATLGVAGATLLTAGLVWPLRRRFDRQQRPTRLSWRVSLAGPLRLALRDPTLRRLTLTATLLAGCQVAVGAFTVLYLTADLGFGLIAAGGIFAGLQAGGFGGRVLWGFVAERLVPSRLVLAGLALAEVALLAVFAAAEPTWGRPALVAVAVALGACTFGWNGVLLSQVAARAPAGRAGDATAGLQFFMFGGVVVFPPLFGALVQAVGSHPVPFLALAGLAGLAAALVVTVDGKPPVGSSRPL